jgi:hypothetical protein
MSDRNKDLFPSLVQHKTPLSTSLILFCMCSFCAVLYSEIFVCYKTTAKFFIWLTFCKRNIYIYIYIYIYMKILTSIVYISHKYIHAHTRTVATCRPAVALWLTFPWLTHSKYVDRRGMPIFSKYLLRNKCSLCMKTLDPNTIST